MIDNIRAPQITDINYLLDIDLKCFDDPWDTEKWREIYSDAQYKKLVGTNCGNPVGFVVWCPHSDGIQIVRIAVKPLHRKQGIGSQLLKAVRINALQQKYRKICMVVTESLCCPNQGDNIGHWLNNRGFFANEICKDGSIYCGKVEDAFFFVLNLGS